MANTPPQSAPKPYLPPRLVELGTVEDLTQGSGPGASPDDFSAVVVS